MIAYRVISTALAAIVLGASSTAAACMRQAGGNEPMIVVQDPTVEPSKEGIDVPIVMLTGLLQSVAVEFAENIVAADTIDSYALKLGCERAHTKRCLAEKAHDKRWFALETSIIASGSTFQVKQSLINLETMASIRVTTKVVEEAARLVDGIKDSTRSILRGALKTRETRTRPCI